GVALIGPLKVLVDVLKPIGPPWADFLDLGEEALVPKLGFKSRTRRRDLGRQVGRRQVVAGRKRAFRPLQRGQRLQEQLHPAGVVAPRFGALPEGADFAEGNADLGFDLGDLDGAVSVAGAAVVLIPETRRRGDHDKSDYGGRESRL